MPRFFLLLFFISSIARADSQPAWQHGRLKVSADKHDLQYEDGTAFFWLGDTGWELFSRLTLGEIEHYLDNRVSKGFNVIQTTILPEYNMTRRNRYGSLPLQDLNPLLPDEKYFSVIDSAIKMALRRNMFMALVATWGDKVAGIWGNGPIIFDSTNAYLYGKWLGNRYRHFPNIIWIMGGDRPPITDTSDYRPVWRAMANGIIEATRHHCLITYHPPGEKSSSRWMHHEKWLDFNMIQSSHGRADAPTWEWIKNDRTLLPAKPVIDAEPNYEDHPKNPWPSWKVENGYFRDYDVRKQSYRAVFSGGSGVTYGHHAIWQFLSEREENINHAERGWLNALDRPGAYQVGYLRKLIESRPMKSRVPDNSIIADGQADKGEHIEAFRGADNSYAMIYMPVGKPVVIHTQFMKTKKVLVWWFNPKDAVTTKAGVFTRTGKMEFIPPTTGFENDWVLIIEDPERKFKTPGK